MNNDHPGANPGYDGFAASADAHPSAQQLARFARDVLQCLWEGIDLDGAELQDIAEKHKLIRCVPFDPEVHADIHGVDPYPGDDWYVEIPGLAALAKVEAR